MTTISLTNSTIVVENKIIQVIFAENSQIVLDNAHEIVDKVAELAKSGPQGLLIDASSMQFISGEARKYFASRKNPNLTAVAIVINSGIQKTFANLYLNFSRPVVPTQIFNQKSIAINWFKGKI